MNKWPTAFFGYLLGSLFHLFGEVLHKRAEIFVQHSLTRQKAIHASDVTKGTQVATKKNSVEPCYTAHDTVSVPFHKLLHDAPPIESANPIMKASVMEHLFYLVAALLRCVSAFSAPPRLKMLA